jgi:DNA-binding NarL/FixJ family response regulator
MRRTLTRLLSEVTGVEIVGEAQDLEAATAAVPELRPDLVLLDVHLLGKAGQDLLTAITREDDAPFVMMLSDDVSSAYEKHYLDAGADFLVYKPSGLGKVLAIIQNLLKHSAGNQGAGGFPERG